MTIAWGRAVTCLLILTILPAAAPAQDVVKLGEFEDWAAYSSGAGDSKVCYVVSQATTRQPAQPERQAYVYLAHRPGKKTYNVVMVYSGHPYASGSAVQVEIGRQAFQLFTHRETAWAADAATDQDLERAMRLGRKMTVRSSPAEGGPSVDTYSLSGVGKAVDRIATACPRDRRR